MTCLLQKSKKKAEKTLPYRKIKKTRSGTRLLLKYALIAFLFYPGWCWKQYPFAILVICLHLVPALVFPLHCTVWLCPCGLFCGPGEVLTVGGLHTLHGSNPSSFAFSIVISSDTFLTVLQFPKWYFSPRWGLIDSLSIYPGWKKTE